MLITLQFYASGGSLQTFGDSTASETVDLSIDLPTPVYNADAITLQFYASGGSLQTVGDSTASETVDLSIDLSTPVYNADAILETITVLTQGKMHSM